MFDFIKSSMRRIKYHVARRALLAIDPFRDVVSMWALRLLVRNSDEVAFLAVMNERLSRYGMALRVAEVPVAGDVIAKDPEPGRPAFVQTGNTIPN